MSSPERILIVRTSALGDVVHSLPVLTALRRRFPEAAIGWVVERHLAPLLEGHAGLDRLIPVDTKGWRKRMVSARTWRSIASFVRALRSFRAEVVLDLMGNYKGGVIAALCGAERKIGPRRRDRREPSSALWINEPVAVAGEHAVERALDLLEALGVPRTTPDFDGGLLSPGSAPPAALETLGGDDFFIIHPGAGWHNKRYPPALWSRVASELAQASGLRCAVAFGPGEHELAASVQGGADGAIALDAPDLGGLTALLRRARLVLGGDTGPIHLAHALGTPAVALMGPTDPARHGPYGSPERSLAVRLPCSFCYQRLDEPKACMLEIRPAAVVERALALLAATGR